MDNIQQLQKNLSDYFIDHVVSIYVPPFEPYNGLKNDNKYMEVILNMNEWNIKYKSYPAKRKIKDLYVSFNFDDMDIKGIIKDYRLCQYGCQCMFILKDFETNNKLDIDIQ